MVPQPAEVDDLDQNCEDGGSSADDDLIGFILGDDESAK